MGKKTPQAPTPPDPYKTAGAQMGSNISTAIANATIGNANQYGPMGSTTFDVIGEQTITGPDGQIYKVPKYSQTTKLSPEQQRLYDQQTQLGYGLNDLARGQVDRLGNVLGAPISADGLPERGTLTGMEGRLSTNDFSADRARVEKAMFDRINPQLDRDRSALETSLVNQGFQRGTDAFHDAMGEYGRNVNDQRLAITAKGLQEQQGLFGMDLSRAQQDLSRGAFKNSNRSQALQEMLALRNQPINEISALMSGGQVSLPNVQGYNAPQVANTNVGDYVYNSAALANQQYKMQLDQQNAQMGGLFGLGQAGILGALKYGPTFMSDRRVKTDIRDLGIRLMNGVKLYAFKYIVGGKRMVGVMADELAKVRPDAVARHSSGYLVVNYGAL